jgi:hypothetical protein
MATSQLAAIFEVRLCWNWHICIWYIDTYSHKGRTF